MRQDQTDHSRIVQTDAKMNTISCLATSVNKSTSMTVYEVTEQCDP